MDGIQEHEKYGNDGSQHEVVGKAVVQGSETISKFLNAAIDVSFFFFGKSFNSSSSWILMEFEIFFLGAQNCG